MQRIVFYGIIVAVVVIVILLAHLLFYGLLRIVLSKASAQLISRCVLIAILVTIAVSSIYGHYITRLQVNVTQTDVVSNRLPKAFDGYRIAQLSDFHLDSFDTLSGCQLITDIITQLRQQQPDLIVFTGDLVTLRAAETYPYRNALSQLASIPAADGNGVIPVYSILGNHDYADYMRNYDGSRRKLDVDTLIQVQQNAGWHVLRNNSLFISHNADSIVLAGVENIGEPPFSVYGDLDLALDPVGGTAITDILFTVLLSHNPTHWRSEVLPRTCIDLTLSGHTHATQLLLGNWSPAQWKYPEWMGLYSETSTPKSAPQYLYVNTGLGCVGPKVRIGIRPEVSILTLRSSHN